MKKMMLLIVVLVMLAGCGGGDPQIYAAAQAEGELLESYRAFVVNVMDAMYDDLDEAYGEQIEIILDYELRLNAEGDKIALGMVQEILIEARQKRAELRSTMRSIREKLLATDLTMAQALKLHERITAYLNRRKIEKSDVVGLLDAVKNFKPKGGD